MRHLLSRIGSALIGAALWLLCSLPAAGYGPFTTPATRYIHAGDTVVLNRDLDAGAGSRIYLQHGKVVAKAEFRHREPYCYFHVYRDSAVISTPFSVSADRFSITGTGRSIEYSYDVTPGYTLAGLGFLTQDASEQFLMIRFALDSPSQPQVRWLKCGVFAVPNERNYLGIDEVRGALGDLVALEPGGN